MDKEDDCPNVAGLLKFNGCPDTDEDGVMDKVDQCPNTPKGCPVDAVGCPLDS
ncbi:MAG: thrombospondin type 3 repeat-containing protein, partial [Draconibacterium sp.]|nr:thrombospondin type 3 repeat-containing protein [Draconibacterium sp.]